MKLLLYLMLTTPFLGFSHSPDAAFFDIFPNKDTTIIKAELPWTIKRGLLQFAPHLKNSKNIEDYKVAFFEYVKTSIVISDYESNPLKLHSVEEYFVEGAHTDQNNFLIKFVGKSPKTVKNTLQFNLFKNQQNYHYSPTDEFITTSSKPSFELPKTKLNYFLIGCTLTSILSILLLLYFKKNYKNSKIS